MGNMVLDGSKKEVGNYAIGRKEGQWRGWYKNGQKKYVMHYKNNLNMVFLPNGQKMVDLQRTSNMIMIFPI